MSENFEKRVKNILDEVQFEPHDAVWRNVKNAIKPEKKKRRFIFWWLLPFVLAGVVFTYLMTGEDSGETVADNTVQTSVPKDSRSPEIEFKVVTQGQQQKDKSKSFLPLGNGIVSVRKTTKSRASRSKSTQQVLSNHVEEKTIVTISASENKVNVFGGDISSKTSIAAPDHEVAKDKLKVPQSTTQQIMDTLRRQPNIAETGSKGERDQSKWQFGFSAEVGVANKVQSLTTSKTSDSRISFSTIPNSTSSGTLGSTYYQSTTATGKLLFGIGIAAQKKIARKLFFQASFGYQHQQFSNTTSIFKDSAAPVFVDRSNKKYALHAINIYTAVSYKFLQFEKLKLGVGAGIDNQVLLAARFSQDKYLFSSGQLSSETRSSLKDYNVLQPHLRVQLTTDVHSLNRNSLQLSPYFRYSLLKFQKSGNKDHLMSFGLTATYFFK